MLYLAVHLLCQDRSMFLFLRLVGTAQHQKKSVLAADGTYIDPDVKKARGRAQDFLAGIQVLLATEAPQRPAARGAQAPLWWYQVYWQDTHDNTNTFEVPAFSMETSDAKAPLKVKVPSKVKAPSHENMPLHEKE